MANPGFCHRGFASNELSYSVYSENLNSLEKATKDIEKIMADSEHLIDVKSSFEEGFEEFTIKVDQETLLQHGLTTGEIVMLLNPSKEKEVVTTIEKDGVELNVTVQKKVETHDSFNNILDQQIPTLANTFVRLGDIVEIEEGTAPAQLDRSAGQYYASVSGTIVDDDISKATSEIDKKLQDLELPKGVEIDLAGVAADMQETFTQLGVAILGAILIVYFILVVTFGEGLAPFAILFSLPFTIIGAVVGLWIGGETISVTVLMGLLMLVGIVVTNSIVLVDRIIRMERSGMEMREAILEAGATRLRPILMTAIATIGALIPLLFESGSSAMLISKGLGITVIGGLTTSTLLTLVIVPIVYEALSKLLKKNRRFVDES